jgi:hypothetical protein
MVLLKVAYYIMFYFIVDLSAHAVSVHDNRRDVAFQSFVSCRARATKECVSPSVAFFVFTIPQPITSIILAAASRFEEEETQYLSLSLYICHDRAVHVAPSCHNYMIKHTSPRCQISLGV